MSNQVQAAPHGGELARLRNREGQLQQQQRGRMLMLLATGFVVLAVAAMVLYEIDFDAGSDTEDDKIYRIALFAVAIALPLFLWTAARLKQHMWFRIVVFVAGTLYFWALIGWMLFWAAALLPNGSVTCQLVACDPPPAGNTPRFDFNPLSLQSIVIFVIALWISVQMVWPPSEDDQDTLDAVRARIRALESAGS